MASKGTPSGTPPSPRSVARQLCHWGPMIALTLISLVIISATYSSIQLYGLPTVKYIKTANFFSMYAMSFIILYVYYKAFKGPGFVPLNWKPTNEDNVKFLQYCTICQGYKAPRSHHCTSCGRCVMKMDHHCPWINCCVGHNNHTPFIAFLFYLPIGCIYAVILNANFLYRLLNYEFLRHRRILPINTYTIFLTISGIAFSIGAALGVLILLYVQIRTVLRNKTQIEDWICDKALSRRDEHKELKPFVYPYNLGWKKNWKQVIHCSLAPVGDGLSWPVVKGCTQYTLTIEQIEQKKEKKKRGVDCRVTQSFKGSRLSTCSNGGPMVCLCAPCLEPLISIEKNDIVTVFRWRKRWVYVNKHISDEEISKGKRVRGWIPRSCVLVPHTCNNHKPKKEKKDDNHDETVTTNDRTISKRKTNKNK